MFCPQKNNYKKKIVSENEWEFNLISNQYESWINVIPHSKQMLNNLPCSQEFLLLLKIHLFSRQVYNF